MLVCKPFIIADTTYNHEGDINYLFRMVDEIAEIGLDAVKFHLLFDIDDYMEKSHPSYNKIKDMLISEDEWSAVIDYAIEKGLNVVALCDDVASIKYAMRKGVDEIEIHSSSIKDFVMLEACRDFSGNIMLGIGGASFDTIANVLVFLGRPVTLMYGFNGWPTKPCDINIRRMQKIHGLFGMPVGYADHTIWDDKNNTVVSCAAAFSGFSILEKHYTLNPGVERVDYRESVGKKQMKQIMDMMNLACCVYGNILMSDSEKHFIQTIGKVGGKRR